MYGEDYVIVYAEGHLQLCQSGLTHADTCEPVQKRAHDVMDRPEILANPSKKERMTSIDRLEIIANPTKKESALFSRRFATISNPVHHVMSCFYRGDTTL